MLRWQSTLPWSRKWWRWTASKRPWWRKCQACKTLTWTSLAWQWWWTGWAQWLWRPFGSSKCLGQTHWSHLEIWLWNKRRRGNDDFFFWSPHWLAHKKRPLKVHGTSKWWPHSVYQCQSIAWLSCISSTNVKYGPLYQVDCFHRYYRSETHFNQPCSYHLSRSYLTHMLQHQKKSLVVWGIILCRIGIQIHFRESLYYTNRDFMGC